jgi:hypothetical protein
MPQDTPSEHPATLVDAVQDQHDRAVADYLGGDYASPAGHATELPGTGDGGAVGAGAVSAVPPPDATRQGRIRARLRRRISRPAEPSDVDVIKARLAQEHEDAWIELTPDES